MRPYCIWFTGMPNAGKSTLVYYLLQKELRNCIVIDGDKFRQHINPELSFTRDNIIENNRTAIKVANYLMGEGFNVLVAMITPFREMRDLARKEIDNYIEVYLSCPEEVRSTRPNFKASQIEYEIPTNPDIVLETDKKSIEYSVKEVLQYVKRVK